MAICSKCGREFADDDLFEIDDELMCEECAEAAGYARCQDCGEWFLAEEGYEFEGEPLCESCYEYDYFTCEDCGDVFRNEDIVEIHGRNGTWGFVCQDCADNDYCRCMDCGEYFISRAGYTDTNGDFLCEDCYTWHDWGTCEDCGCFSRDLAEGEDDCYYCPCCIDDHNRRDVIHRYGFKPEAVIRKRMNELDTEFTFGVEDEVDGRDWGLSERAEPTAEEIADLTDRVYMKHDGSLNTGFEIVSHPGTLAHHLYEMPGKGICSKALKAGFRSHDAGTCGLHIHVGRAGLGNSAEERDITIRKVIVIVNRYWDELARFTRRTTSQLNQWAACNSIAGYRLDAVINDDWAADRIRTHNSHSARYVAINCENEATIEFRIFRGTLKRDTIIASLQLCWNICKYAMTHDWNEVQSGNWLDVCRYKHWNELDAYLTLRGLAPACPPAQDTGRAPSFGGADGISSND